MASILLVTFVFHAVIPVNETTIGFLYLISVLMIAALWGLAESVLASITATSCFNYFFLPPTGTWTIADPENWVALFTFLVTSLIASQLSDRAKRRAIEAMSRQVEIERLYSLSRAMMLVDLKQPIETQIAKEVARIYEIPVVAIYDCLADDLHCSGGDISDYQGKLRETALTGLQVRDDQSDVLIAPICLGGQSIGSLALKGGVLSETALHALLNLIAISMENARSRNIAIRADAARHSEEFKSMLLDGLAHEFKTPLTSITAAATALLTSSLSNTEQRHELLTVVDQEAERLSRLVTEAIHLARIEAGKIQLNRRLHSVTRLIQTAIEQMELLLDGRRIDLSLAPDLPDLPIDEELMQLALRQLLDNAVKYSPQSSSIRITARRIGDTVAIGVHNWGRALPESEQLRIFEKFYRGNDARHQVAGTGMGLAIAREILLAHGGDIRVESSGDHGTEFIASLPCARKGF